MSEMDGGRRGGYCLTRNVINPLTASELKDSRGAWGGVADPHLAGRNLTAAGGWMDNPGLTQ